MDIGSLIDSFTAKRPDASAYEELTRLWQAGPPDEVEAFATAAVQQFPHGTALSDTLSYLSEEAFARLIERAVHLLEQGEPADGPETVIAHAALEVPGAVQPYLETLFTLRPNADSYYENWPWRGAGDSDVAFLAAKLRSPDPDDRAKAWECLMETRKPGAMQIAIDAADRADHPLSVESQLLQLGYTSLNKRHFSKTCAHLVFPPDYFGAAPVPWLSRTNHPTYRLPGAGSELRFGGAGSTACGMCGGELHHLVTLPATQVFGDGQSGTVALEVCLSCLGWEAPVMHFTHGASGHPRPLDKSSAQPEFVRGPFRETVVRLAPTPPRWEWQDWALSNSRQNLNRVGGHPCWVQDADYPECVTCGDVMHFMMQLDSGFETTDGEEFLWGSGGICYGFRCAPCRNTAFLWQCT